MNNKTRGNALFLILIAVALFAALSYAVTQSGRGGGNTSKETTTIETANLIQQMNLYSMTVQKMILMGCDPTEISFNSPLKTQNNINSPSDNSCHLFEPEGGGLTLYYPNEDLYDSSHSAMGSYGEMLFLRGSRIYGMEEGGLGSYTAHISVPYLREDVCLEINKKLHNVSAIPTDTDNTYRLEIAFTGGFSSGASFGCEVDDLGGGDCVNQVGCFLANETAETSGPAYVAVQFLMSNRQ